MADDNIHKKRGWQLKSWKPGQSGNPGGTSKIPEDLRKLRQLNRIELERTINKYLYLDAFELKATVDNPVGLPMLDMIIASILWQAAAKGDQVRLEFMLDRLLGKVPIRVKDVTDLEAKEKLPTPQEALEILQNDPANQPSIDINVKDLE